MDWVKKISDDEISVRYVMEAAGVYHQKFAYYLSENNYEVSIVLPNKISNYMRTWKRKLLQTKVVHKQFLNLD